LEKKDAYISPRTGIFSKTSSFVTFTISRQSENKLKGMLSPQSGEMEQPKIFGFKYSFIHKGSNDIGDEGCKWIVKADWPKLS